MDKLSKSGFKSLRYGLLVLPLLAGCGSNQPSTSGDGAGAPSTGNTGAKLSGEIAGDGSSTVYPLSEAVTEEFGNLNSGVRVKIGISGTGGGFKKLIAGDIAIQNASRPIKKSEAEKMAAGGRKFIELPVAYDGLSVVVNPQNTWATCLTTAELKKIWDKGSKVNNWSQVRAGFPDQPLRLYGPGTDSGTFDYFTDEINGEGGRSRSDYTASEDDNTLVQGVSKEKGALGYFGYSYYLENQEHLKLVQINEGDGCVAPSTDTIRQAQYQPLSRPLFVYVDATAATRPEVKAYVHFMLDNAAKLAGEVGFVPLPDQVYKAARQRFDKSVTGSVYAAPGNRGKTVEQLFTAS